MTGSSDVDFNPELPSPLQALRNLRADARDAVVAVGAQTGAQAAAYVRSALDEAITLLARADPLPHAIFVTGSAGGGKSGAAEYQQRENPGLFFDIVEDATHSDGPSRDQAATLAERLAPLADGNDLRPDQPILVAANIGMIVQLAALWRERGYGFDALISQLFSSLGLPGAPSVPDGAVPLDVRVLNLDDRPTSGPGGLLPSMLPLLQPAPSGTVFNDARCGTCLAIEYCPARANAALLAGLAADLVDDLAARAAIERGRQDTPRALWDFLSRVALPESHYGTEGDPCLASQRAHREDDKHWVATGLLPVTLFAARADRGSAQEDLGARIGRLDPARAPTADAYEAFAGAGLLPADDAAPLRELIEAAREHGSEEPALATAEAALAEGARDGADDLSWRATAARLRLGVSALLGRLTRQEAAGEDAFLAALEVYERWQRLEAAGEDTIPLVDEMEERLGSLVDELGKGLARLFGETLDGRTFLPVQNYDPREPSRAFVQFDLAIATAPPALDRPTAANPEGTALIGYRPLAVSLDLDAGIRVSIDLPTYRLLADARRGLAGGSGDPERTFALRRAAEAIARAAAETEDVTMLVTDPSSGRRYQVTSQKGLAGRVNLRARAVNE
ncbi:hypothetical protein [Modestobacter sp. SYSU DS0511]